MVRCCGIWHENSDSDRSAFLLSFFFFFSPRSWKVDAINLDCDLRWLQNNGMRSSFKKFKRRRPIRPHVSSTIYIIPSDVALIFASATLIFSIFKSSIKFLTQSSIFQFSDHIQPFFFYNSNISQSKTFHFFFKSSFSHILAHWQQNRRFPAFSW